MAHNGSDNFSARWVSPEDEWSMETDEILLHHQFGRPMARGEMMMHEKIIHKDFYNDFGDIFDPDNSS